MTSDDQDEPTHELLMPFVSVQSKGGPHDDASYAAGYEMGKLDAELSCEGFLGHGRPIHAENAGQADLIAMRHGYRTELGDEQDGWRWLDLHRAETEQR